MSIKSWKVTYQHPDTGEEVNSIVHAENQNEAWTKACKDNVPTKGETFFWKILSVEEVKE